MKSLMSSEMQAVHLLSVPTEAESVSKVVVLEYAVVAGAAIVTAGKASIVAPLCMLVEWW